MFQHCQPMRNHHTEQLHEGNGKINSKKVSGQSSSIQLVSPYIISPWLKLAMGHQQLFYYCHPFNKLEIFKSDQLQPHGVALDGASAVPAGADRAPRLRVLHPRRRHREVPLRVPAREVNIHYPDITRGSRDVRVWQVRALLQRTRG